MSHKEKIKAKKILRKLMVRSFYRATNLRHYVDLFRERLIEGGVKNVPSEYDEFVALLRELGFLRKLKGAR